MAMAIDNWSTVLPRISYLTVIDVWLEKSRKSVVGILDRNRTVILKRSKCKSISWLIRFILG